jgi:hypothetical protein
MIAYPVDMSLRDLKCKQQDQVRTNPRRETMFTQTRPHSTVTEGYSLIVIQHRWQLTLIDRGVFPYFHHHFEVAQHLPS